MKNWLLNKTVIITGASSGIGKEMAKILINKFNCVVVGVARHEENLVAFKNSLEEKKDKFLYVCADVSKKEDWQKIYEYSKNKNCTLLINNAGTMLPFAKADKFEEKQIRKLFETNFYSCIYGYKTFCNVFRNVKGCGMVNIASASAICFLPGQSFYSASKSALTSFSRIISSEEKSNFFVGTYLPGFTKTGLFTNKDNAKPIFDSKAEKIINKICMPTEKMARKIIKAIEKKKRYKLIGKDAKLIKVLTSLMSNKTSDLFLNAFEKTKWDCFKEVLN